MSLLSTTQRVFWLALCVLGGSPALAQTSTPGGAFHGAGTSTATVGQLPAALRAVVQEDKLLAADGAENDVFGDDVSIFGDRAIVGAYGNEGQGAAYIYVRSGDSWVQEAKLTVDGGTSTSVFGTAVSLSDDRAVVGSPTDGAFLQNNGAVYVFVRDGSTWTQEARLSADDGEAGDYFGWSVSLLGDRVLIGARFADDRGPRSGTAYTFVRNGSDWTQEARLSPGSPGVGDQNAGISVSLTADRALVGAAFTSVDGVRAGAAYVYRREGSAWTQEALLTPPTPTDFSRFGFASALSDDRALVGARGEDEAGENSGAAYMYVRTGTDWALESTLLGNDTGPDDGFGISVALQGDEALVGAPGGGAFGTVYLFERDGADWVQQEALTASDGELGTTFGFSLDVSGDRVLVGAISDDDNGSLSGSAYVFSGVTAVADERGAETAQALSGAVPNPSSRRATLVLTLDAPERVRATVLDLLGREVAVLLSGEATGETRLTVDTSSLPPGVYVVRVDGETFADAKRLTVVR